MQKRPLAVVAAMAISLLLATASAQAPEGSARSADGSIIAVPVGSGCRAVLYYSIMDNPNFSNVRFEWTGACSEQGLTSGPGILLMRYTNMDGGGTVVATRGTASDGVFTGAINQAFFYPPMAGLLNETDTRDGLTPPPGFIWDENSGPYESQAEVHPELLAFRDSLLAEAAPTQSADSASAQTEAQDGTPDQGQGADAQTAQQEQTAGGAGGGAPQTTCAATPDETVAAFYADFTTFSNTNPPPPQSLGARAQYQWSYFLAQEALRRIEPIRQCLGPHYNTLLRDYTAMSTTARTGCDQLASGSQTCPDAYPR